MGKIIDYTTTTPKSTFENLVSTRIEYVNIYNHLMEQVNNTLNEVEGRNIVLANAILGDKSVVYINCTEFDVWVQDNDVEQRYETVCCVVISKSGNDIINFAFVLKDSKEICNLDEKFDYSYHLDLNNILEEAVVEFSK